MFDAVIFNFCCYFQRLFIRPRKSDWGCCDRRILCRLQSELSLEVFLIHEQLEFNEAYHLIILCYWEFRNICLTKTIYKWSLMSSKEQGVVKNFFTCKRQFRHLFKLMWKKRRRKYFSTNFLDLTLHSFRKMHPIKLIQMLCWNFLWTWRGTKNSMLEN